MDRRLMAAGHAAAAMAAGVEGQVDVLVEHPFEYTGQDGRHVVIRPNERYRLLCRSTPHWWHPPCEAGPEASPGSVGSHKSLEGEWDQYWDEESRRVFFYNPLTGETAWEDAPRAQAGDADEDTDLDVPDMWPGPSPGSPGGQRVPVPAPRSIHKTSRDGATPAPASPPQEKIKTLDKAGVLHCTRTADKGKRLRKKHWSTSWTVLEGGVLTFFKDSKTSATGGLRQQPSKLSTPEYTVELKGASLSWAPKDKSSKKNVLELRSRDGSEYLIQHDSEGVISAWHQAIGQGIEEPPADPALGEDVEASSADFRSSEREDGTGLDTDGLYRISGNLATIQKLRYHVDHDERLDLDDGRWTDVHVLTGALKLFLRELPEPLFPFSHFSQFLAAIKLQDPARRGRCVRDLVRSLPTPNHDTLQLLFQHLRRVVEQGEQNRMSVQSVAIVFGPTLLRPETEEGSMPMTMVFQNQVVELILQQCADIFPPP
ncbi:Rho GTPase-activating protein 27 [Heterocephalus glaber]|uniref:Rho GTPase-activating protein 27 n=1 Tax=Heterocephalus glaber TaxID=10181 RepID=G5BIZ2_HETGA|nr:Rho GTPase-activating protein 27 [Heterocephalus glaber]